MNSLLRKASVNFRSVNKTFLRISIFILIVVGFCCCVQVVDETNAVQKVIYGIIAADNQSDINRVMSYYHTEAVLVPPGKPEIKGWADIKNNYKSIFASSSPQLKVTIEEIKVSEAFAVAYGLTMGEVFLKSDSSIRKVHDRYSMLLEKENSEWKIKRLQWGSAETN
jgi:uncharacterized protein (TIGR02246 family)